MKYHQSFPYCLNLLCYNCWGGGHKNLLNLMENVHFITPLSTAAVMGALLHRKLASTWDSEPVFLLQFNLPYFIKYSQIALRS